MYIMRIYLFILCVVVAASSCKQQAVESVQQEGHYFSIKEFALDQWNTYHGQPFGIQKIVYMNGRVDSVYTNADGVNWAAILKMFFETDISDSKFEDKYSFSEFADPTTLTENFYYEAKDPKLLTQKLHIMADLRNHRITSIYIETVKNNKWGSKMQRLYYEPVKSISIQEFETMVMGKRNEVRVEYKFM